MEFVEYIKWTVTHLGAWLLMLLCAAGMGNLFVRKCRFRTLTERLVFTVAAGLGLCALLLFLLGLIGVLYRPVIWILTLLGATAAILSLLHSNRRLVTGAWRERKPPRFKNELVFWLAIFALCYWAMLLLATQYPPIQWDATMHHLPVARAFLSEHRLVPVMGVPMAVLPALNHMLFTWALALNDDILAQMVEHTFLMLTAGGLIAWGMRRNQPVVGFASAFFWLANALVLWLAASAYVDIAATCYVFLGVYALRVFWDTEESLWWYSAMALFGMAAGVKIQGIFFLGMGALIGLWPLMKAHNIPLRFIGKVRPDSGSQQTKSRPELRCLVQGWGLALVIAIPWYAFIGYHTGNPLWPAFPNLSSGIWGAPWVIENVNGWMRNAHEPRTIVNFVKLPFDWIFHPSTFYAEVGLSLFPLIIAWPLAWIVSLFDRSVRWWTFWALIFTLFWFSSVHQLRYWLPALPLAIIALCESVQWVLGRLSKAAAFHKTALVALSLLALMWGARLVLKDIKSRGLPPVTPIARENYLSQLGGYLGVKYLNENADENETVCVLNASWLNYYFHQHVIDLRTSLYQNRRPTFRWPNDQLWTEWLEYQDAKWVFIYYKDPALNIPKQNPVVNPFWPDYQLVYADTLSWVFHRKPVAPVAGIKGRFNNLDPGSVVREVPLIH